jgi:hypothetical protein
VALAVNGIAAIRQAVARLDSAVSTSACMEPRPSESRTAECVVGLVDEMQHFDNG